MQKNWLCVSFFLMMTVNVVAQEAEKAGVKEDHTLKGTHRFSILIGHSHLSHGIMENNKQGWTVIPSWAIDYDYWISNYWGIGLQNDIMLETFKVEDHENVVIERTRPVASVASVIYKPKEHLGYIAGMGGEFAKEENFLLTRLGIESGWEMKNNWEFSSSLVYDIKWNGYDTWAISVGISKLFKKHRDELATR